MEAKDTVMNDEDIIAWIGLSKGYHRRARNKDMSVIYNFLAQRQAEISFKAGEQQGIEKGRNEVIPFAEKFLTMAEHGDYSNGNDAFGIDEGRVRAGELLDKYREEWQAFLKRINKEEKGEKLEKAKLRKEQIPSGRSIGSNSSTGGVTQLYDTYYLIHETIIETLKRGEIPEEGR